jgi:homoserine kinase
MSSARASVHVPASTSNLGSGFDCIGMAVDRWLSASVVIDAAANAIVMTRGGSLASLTCSATDDLIHEGFAAACTGAGREVPRGITYTVTSTIPVARGLGSSAAALVAGAALADAVLELGMGVHGVATLVSQIEGHPDNASPAAFGGAMLGVANDDATASTPCTYAFSRLPVHDSLAFIFAVPPLEVTTAAARAVLPTTVPFGDAVCALQRSAALTHGLATGDDALLHRALDDVLHVPYRRSLVPGYDAVVAGAKAARAFGATLSGSGSSMVAIGRREHAAAIALAMQHGFASAGLAAETHVTSGMVGGLRIDASPVGNFTGRSA